MLWSLGIKYGLSVHICLSHLVLWSFGTLSPVFWYFVPRRIWHPCVGWLQFAKQRTIESTTAADGVQKKIFFCFQCWFKVFKGSWPEQQLFNFYVIYILAFEKNYAMHKCINITEQKNYYLRYKLIFVMCLIKNFVVKSYVLLNQCLIFHAYLYSYVHGRCR
jgi:hypothetical protein